MEKIICLTEESVETLYLLNAFHLIKGRSQFAKRPSKVKSIPIVSQYIKMNLAKIKRINPDLIIGHSDLQKDIAAELIANGFNVFISNHCSLKEILDYILLIGRMVDRNKEAKKLVRKYKDKIISIQNKVKNKQKVKVYFEEWDDPRITSINWVTEIIEFCNGAVIKQPIKDKLSLAKNRIVNDQQIIKFNPDIIFLCWCGKKANFKSVYDRNGYETVNAIKNKRVFELAPEIFLQPGPAIFEEGIDLMFNYLNK